MTFSFLSFSVKHFDACIRKSWSYATIKIVPRRRFRFDFVLRSVWIRFIELELLSF